MRAILFWLAEHWPQTRFGVLARWFCRHGYHGPSEAWETAPDAWETMCARCGTSLMSGQTYSYGAQILTGSTIHANFLPDIWGPKLEG